MHLLEIFKIYEKYILSIMNYQRPQLIPYNIGSLFLFYIFSCRIIFIEQLVANTRQYTT